MDTKRIILFIILILILLIIFLPGYTKIQDLVAENKSIEERVNKLQESVIRLTKEKEQLKNDILYIEKIAREKLRLLKKGEKRIEVKE